MFAGWDNFYILVGSAAGALIGLLFVVMTLTSGMDRDKALAGASRYMTPTLLLFVAPLLVSAIASAPVGQRLQRAAIAILALVLLAGALVTVRRMFFPTGDRPTHWTDPWWYAAAPAGAYLLLAGVASAGSAIGVGATAVVVLLLGVRNAWDLITWIAPGGGEGSTPPPG